MGKIAKKETVNFRIDRNVNTVHFHIAYHERDLSLILSAKSVEPTHASAPMNQIAYKSDAFKT